MPGKRSAGLLLFRRVDGDVQVLLGHMGGPLWARRDAGAWTIPKGEYQPDEQPLDAARREFTEEVGLPVPVADDATLIELGSIRQAGGKVVTAWAGDGDVDPAEIVPGTFDMEWPKGSGQIRQFPELDRVAWFGLDEAAQKLVVAQRAFLDRLADQLSR
jgi:predicted NUDIX family NTP pyrophosphohydrolase